MKLPVQLVQSGDQWHPEPQQDVGQVVMAGQGALNERGKFSISVKHWPFAAVSTAAALALGRWASCQNACRGSDIHTIGEPHLANT